MRPKKTSNEIADLIERFLSDQLAYPQEWNDFVNCESLVDLSLKSYWKRCYDLDPLVNCPNPVDETAVAELRCIAVELRCASTD